MTNVFVLSYTPDLWKGLCQTGHYLNKGCRWSDFINTWNCEPEVVPEVKMVWISLPDNLSTPVNRFWNATTVLVTVYQALSVPILIATKHSRREGCPTQHGGLIQIGILIYSQLYHTHKLHGHKGSGTLVFARRGPHSVP